MATQTLSIAPQAVEAEHALPGWVMRMLEAIVVTSFVVVIEPAPTDLLFVALAGALFFTGRIVLPATFNLLVWGGLFIFLTGDFLSISFVRFHLTRAIFSWAVSLYMIVSFVLYASLLFKGGPIAVKRMLRALQLAGIACALVGIVGLLGIFDVGRFLYRDDAALRIRSTFKDPNVMGPFLVPAFLITLDYLRQRKQVLWNLAAILVISIILLVCFSRAAWLNLAVAIAIYTLFQLQMHGNLAQGLSLVTIGIGFIVLVTISVLIMGDSMGFGDYLMSRLRFQGYDTERFRHYGLAVEMCVEKPFGLGPLQTQYVLGKQVHSLYLGVATESGILAALGLLSVVLISLHRSLMLALISGPYRGMFIVIFACLTGQLINSLFVNSMHWRHLFFLLALPWSMSFARARSNVLYSTSVLADQTNIAATHSTDTIFSKIAPAQQPELN